MLSALFTFCVDARATLPNAGANCLIEHLKEREMLESSFPAVPGGLPGQCAAYIEAVAQTAYESVLLALRSQNLEEKYGECVIMSLKENKWAENSMLHAVLISSPSLSAEEKALQTNEIIQTKVKITQKALRMCLVLDFGAMFETMLNKENLLDLVSNYCTRKYVLENNLISSEYKVDLGESVDDSICIDDFEKSRLRIQENISTMTAAIYLKKSSVDCAKERFVQLGFIDKIMAIVVLSELELTGEQKISEKKDFVDLMTRIVIAVSKCEPFE